jgi:hypothetical protein
MSTEALLLWRTRRLVGDHVRQVQCGLAQLGEGCFELRVRAGDDVLVSETFATTADAVVRAEELRRALAPRAGARETGH